MESNAKHLVTLFSTPWGEGGTVGQIGPQWLWEFGENDRFLTASCGIYTSHTLQPFLHILSEKDTKVGF
jgi:hypothetical protein